MAVMEFESIPYEVVRRRVKYSRVEFRPDGLRVIVPRGVDPLKVLQQNKASILRKFNKLIAQLEVAQQVHIENRKDEEFFDLVSDYVNQYSQLLKVKIQKIRYRKMKRRWGSCRSDGVITLNSWLKLMPERLVAYIIYHELAHMLVRGHSKKFKNIILQEYPDYRRLDKELNIYGLRLLS